MGSFFFFNDTATTEIYTLSLHDALPICRVNLEDAAHVHREVVLPVAAEGGEGERLAAEVHRVNTLQLEDRGEADEAGPRDRKSTRLNSSHANISYAVFCLKKKNNFFTRE